MTPEQRIERLERQILQLQARHYTQTAEILTLLAMQRPAQSEAAERWDDEFCAGRNERLQILLLLLEGKDPALAAKLNEALESPGMNFPLTWD